MLRVATLLCAAVLSWYAQPAQAQAVTQETLLNAYYDLWHELGRQPTSEEVEAQTPYSAGRYLEVWEDWDGVRQALVDHLYQRALFAALQQDTDTATEFYQKILEIDPDHPEANSAYGIDLDEAAGRRAEFTVEKAGSPAMSSFMTFLSLRAQGDGQGARDYFMLAQSQKAQHVASETAKLKERYDNAVALYEGGSYTEAIEQFRLLMETRPNQIGYDEIYRPNADAIRQYLEDAMAKNVAARASRIVSISDNSKFSVWITGNWMAQMGEMGLQGTHLRYVPTGEFNQLALGRVPLPGDMKLAPNSYLGGDLGVSFRVTDFLWAGAAWSQLVLTPYAELSMGSLEGSHKLPEGSISAISVFVEPSTMISNTMRVYAQAGVGRYSIDLPDASLGASGAGSLPRLSSHKSASIGGFLGGGCNLWFLATESGLLGVRLDAKYHLTRGTDGSTDRTVTLGGVRLGAGITFSM